MHFRSSCRTSLCRTLSSRPRSGATTPCERSWRATTTSGRLTLDTFLNGSYARHTAVQPIKDVDVIVVVDTDWMQADPSRAMESLRHKLAQRYRDWRTRRQRRAV